MSADTAAVVGGSGFAGGELLRLLDGHPQFALVAATSRQFTNRTVGSVHPNLRHLDLRFSDPGDLEPVDVLFTATPHGVSMERIDEFQSVADTVVDLSADFRLSDPADYDTWYDGHVAPEHLDEAVYGLPEIGREGLEDASLIASGGCNATVTMLGLQPFVEHGLLESEDRVVADLKVGSSEGGAGGGPASSHPERSGVVRPYAPAGHRHEAEIEEHLGRGVSFTVHAVDMVRGAAATSHLFPESLPEKADVWQALRETYGEEPFMRIVTGGGGVYRYPEPKAVAGTNNAEIGFELDEQNGRIVVFTAIDNVMKGASGQAIHAANIAFGYEETAGLEFTGLHP
ncbi:N-acetyl-gamma-glutamyl-phosphate reductase, partial [Halodesulfurarchaeum sp.]|uniref:N-acetyl-gamma-glutamyl-phosphate reductase n=1 Tax=Halodesulfurarchaeum sp. TaxID=1980530 RepID=UPI002FC2CE31